MDWLWANNFAWKKILSSLARSVLSLLTLICFCFFAMPAFATPFTETVPNGNGPIPATYPPVGGTMFVFIGMNGNIYYQFVNPSTQFQGFQFTGTPAGFRGNPFQLGPSQTLNCGPTACVDYFGGSIVEGYARLTARDGDACPGNFDFNDVFFEVNGFRVGSFSGPEQVERTNRTGTTSLGFENCFRNQGSNETSTGWFDLTPVPGLLDNILTSESTTPFVFDDDGSSNRGDNFWFFRDGNDATGTPEVAPGITIVKTADRTSYSAVGDVINYEFLVTNVGSVTLNNIVVTDSFIDSAVSCPATTLLSGQAMTCTGQHSVNQQNIDDDITFRNVATVTANPTEGTLGAVSGELVIPGPAADNFMTITKVPSITSGAVVGDTITYTYEIQNTGNITLNDVNVSDAHNGVGALSAITPTNVTLAPNAIQEFEATYIVQQGDVDAQTDITNIATAEAVPARGTIVEPTANAAVSVVAENRVLTLNKESTTSDFTNLGDTIAYTYEVTNNGNVTITTPITISDDVIDAAGGNVSCPAIPVGGLLPGNSLTCNANYSVTQNDLNTGSVTNIATASDGVATSNSDTVTVTGTQTPELTIDKRLTAASPTSYDSVGDQLFYEYEVSNTGNVTITSAISVSDDRIASVSCQALPAGGLDPGNSILCTGTYTVDQIDIDVGNVINTADATDGTTTSDTDSVTVNATQLPELSLTKTADPINPVDFVVGATANYTYVVTNAGNTTIVDPITVMDSRISSVTCQPLPPGGLLPTQTLTCSGSYVVDGNDVALFEVTNLATATDGNVTSPQVSETIPLGGVPSLSLTKTAAPGSSFAVLGDTITYSFEVTNDGTVSFATPITITDNTIPGSPIACYTPSPANPDLITGESVTCTGSFTYSVTQDDLDAGVVVNEATANTLFMGVTPVVSAPAVETVNANTDPSIAVTKSASPTTFSTVGETLVYTISVNNDGNQTLTNVNITDPLIPSLMCVIPTLAPGATDTSCVGNYVVDQDDIDLGRIDNTASASATTPQGTTINGSGNNTANGPAAAPSVEITKSASPSPFGPEGSIINYTFEVENTGNVRLSNIIVTDPIDAGFSCTIPALDPGTSDTTTCSLNYTVQQGDINTGSITNEASVTATSADPSGQSVGNSDQIVTPGPTRNPAIEIEKVADISGLSSPAQEGDIISYTFRIENTGNVTLTDVDVTDSNATVLGITIPTLEPGDVDTTTFTATRALTQDDINNGSFSNQAEVSADTPTGLPPLTEPSDDPSTGTDDDPTIVQLPEAPSISLTKVGVLDDGGDGRPDVGDIINYTFTVENTGNVTLSDITITDPIVAVSGGPITSLLPTLSDTSTFTASYAITQADINRGEVLNQAVVTGDTPSGGTAMDDSDDPADAASDDDPTIIPLAREASIELEKVATLIDGGDGVDEGDTIEYAFTVTNTGNLPLSGVTITDLQVPVSGGPITIQPGVTNTTSFTATHVITQQNIDDGFFTNTATVNGTGPNGETATDVSDDPADASGNDDPTTVTFVQTPSLALEKVDDISGFSTPPVAGDIITYSFRIENTGNVTLTNIAVTDPLVSVTGTPIALEPGEVDTTTYQATYPITQDDIDAGSFTNQARVAGNPPTGPPVNDLSDDPADPTGEDDPTVTPIQQVPELTTVKEATIVNFANVGDIVTYEYLVTNSGNTSITAPITITDNLITNPADISCPVLPVGGLLPTAPNNTITCTGTYSVTQADLDRGTVTNLASASDGTTTSPTVSETIPDGAPAALAIVKTTTNPPFTTVGEIITYTYEISNNGGRTLTGTTEVFDDRIAGPISCFTGNLVPISLGGTSQTCTATYEVTQADLDAGFVTNEAFAENDNVLAVGTVTSPPDTVTVNAVQTPGITVEKVGTPNFSTPVQVGDTIDYAFTITNTGNVTLTNVIVEDDGVVLSGSPIATLVPFDPTATVQNNIDTTTYTAIRTLTQEDIDAGEFENQASIRATDPDGVEITNDSDDPAVGGTQDPTIVTIPQNPSIELEKTAVLDDFGDGTIEVGDEILYSFRIINNGNVNLSEIFVSDVNATITSDDVIVNPTASNGSISLAPGAEDTTTFVGVHVITLNDLNSGTFANQASVTATTPGSGTISEPSDDPATGTDDDPTVVAFPLNPLIVITKVGTVDDGGDGSVDEGDVINYTFRIENLGNVTLTNITVTDDDAVVSGGPLTSLDPDTVDTDTFTAQHVLTQPEIDSGAYSNQASVEGTPFSGGAPVSDLSDDPFDSTSEDDPTIIELAATPSIEVEKFSTIDDGGDGSVDEGDAINYTFTVTNTGNVTLTDITLTDPDAVVSGGPILSLLPGISDTATFTAQHILTQDEINSGSYENQATVSGNPPGGAAPVTDLSDDPADATGDDDPTVTTIPNTPSIAVQKTGVINDGGDGSVDEGDVINYTFTVTNTGNVTLTDITLTDPDAVVSGGPILSLLPGISDTTTFEAQHALTQDEINSGSYENQATVSGTPPSGPPVTDLSDDPADATGNDDPTIVTIPTAPSISIDKVATIDDGGDGRVDEGDAINYTFTVTNTGNVTLTDISLTDPDAVVSGGPILSLLPGISDTATFTAQHILTQDEINSGSYDNQATVSGNPPGGAAPVTDLSDDPTDPTGVDDPTVTTIPTAPSISVEKVATIDDGGDGSVDEGDAINYTFTITNTGNVTLTDITLTDPDAVVSGGPILSLLPGISDTATFEAQHILTQDEINSGSYENQATVSGNPPGGAAPVTDLSDNPADATGDDDPTITTIPTNASIEVEKVATIDDGGDGRVDEGDAINYTFAVTNTGNVTLTDISLTDPDAVVSGGPILSLLPGISDTATFTAQHILTQDEINSGSYENQATVSGNPPGGAAPVTDLSDDRADATGEDDPTITTIPTAPSISVEKVATIDDGGDGRVDEGDAINYTFTVTNTGNVTLTDITLTDPDAVVSGGPILSLPPGISDTTTFEAQHILTQDEINSGSYENQATVSGNPPGGAAPVTDLSDDPADATGEDDPTITTLPAGPAITIEKTATINDGGDGSIDEGDTIVYTFRIENTGNVTLTNVGVTDPNAVVSGGPITLIPGQIDNTTIGAVHTLTQNEINSGSFENQATVSGTPPTGPAVTDLSDDPTDPTGTDDPTITPLTPLPSIAVEKVADISDFDSPPVPGNEITYTFTVTNTGNVTLSNITLNDPDATVSGGPITALLPGISDTTTFVAVKVLDQDDINSGSFTNQATVSGNPPTGPPVSDLSDDPADATGENDPTVTDIPNAPSMDVTKSLTSVTQVFPFVYDVVYEIAVENTGNVTLTNLQVEDDLSAALAPASVISTNVVTSGFAGTGSDNTTYNGVVITQLFVGDVQLDPTNSGSITITARVDFSAGFPSQGNTATATSDMISVPVLSNDPSVTPGDTTDTNPTPPPLEDTDNDGAPDTAESSTADRDGDGIPDAQDYDPTGYFYCQETARILPGGLISVTGPAGTQTGLGTSNNITIVRDGSDGSFQFFVSAPGTYTLNATLPATGVASTDRLSSGTLDATSLLPANPGVLGAGEIGSTGDLSDGSAAANPFYFTFEIEAGDPAIFNNNIPLIFCGAPELTATKSVSGTPTILSNGNTQFTFAMTAENIGTTQVNNVTLIDDLDAVFGAGNYTVISNTLTSAPTTFGATTNIGYNGGSDTELLQTSGTLLVGERLEVELVVEVMANMSGTFTNTLSAGGASPLDGTPITPNIATTDVTVVAPNDLDQLQVEKVAGRSLVRIGEVLPYSITITNPAALPRIDVNIVDFLPAGLIYRPGTAQINGVNFEPTVSGRRLVFAGQDIPANGSLTITFNVGVSAAASASEFENQAWVEDPISGDRISNIGSATVRRAIEHVFDCGEIIGKVFDDKNRNGYQDKGEPGLPGVRVVTVKGELITTDKHGRYHVPCASVPDANIGSNFILKLDTRTLPTGYRVTTENPRVVRLTRGKLTKLNFGASISRVVRIDLNSTAFLSGSIEPSKPLTNAFGKLIKKLSQEPSVLRLTYHLRGDDSKLAKKRMRNIQKLIKKRWRRSRGNYDLEIETRVVKK